MTYSWSPGVGRCTWYTCAHTYGRKSEALSPLGLTRQNVALSVSPLTSEMSPIGMCALCKRNANGTAMTCISGKEAFLACALTEPPVKKAVARCWNVLLDCVALSLISLVFFSWVELVITKKPSGQPVGEKKRERFNLLRLGHLYSSEVIEYWCRDA